MVLLYCCKVLPLFYLAQLLHPPNGTSTVCPVLGLPNLRVGGRGGLHMKP